MSRNARGVSERPPSVPASPSMYERISGARRSRLKSWLTRARVTPCRRASSAAFLTSPVSIIRRHARARVSASRIRGRLARAARARGPQAWPAASGDGTQPQSVGFTGDAGWHAAASGNGPQERGPSPGPASDDRCVVPEVRTPPARGRTGRPGCVGLPGSGMSTSQPARTLARSARTKLAPQAGLEPATLRLTAVRADL